MVSTWVQQVATWWLRKERQKHNNGNRYVLKSLQMLIHALWGGVVWLPCCLFTLPSLAMLLLKCLFLMLSMQTTVLSLHCWSLIPPVHLHTHIVMMRLDPYRDTYTLAFVFWFPPFCLLLPSAFFHLLFTYIHLSTSSFCCQGTPWGVSQQLYWAFASGVHNSLGFEGFTGCCSDWDEYCVSVQRTASNIAHPYSLCIGQNFSLHTSFSACCSNFTKSIPIH